MAVWPPIGLAPQRVAVLSGGRSAERPISLQSGQTVCQALHSRGHHVTALDPAESDLNQCRWSDFDVAFLALHGEFGEDGQIQALLQQIGIPFTGSDAAASRLAFSKSASKERFFHECVPTPPYVLIHESDDASRIEQHARSLGFPLVVKPDAQGSSLGVTIAHTPDELPQALARCFHYDAFGVLEPAVDGTEWTLGLLDDLVLPLIKIETHGGFYDYQAKYEDDATRYVFEFEESQRRQDLIRSAGLQAAAALQTRGLVRVDLRVDKFGRPWVLEVNTIPGFTDHSLIPKAAARMGIDFGDLCERAIASCVSGQMAKSA